MPKKTKGEPTRPYHHGDLKAVLLAEAETILERDGIQGLTLRAITRAAGVSHAAPKNHFEDLTGLLTELVAVGYRRFGAALSDAMDAAGTDPHARMQAMGTAYVHFAQAYPNLFALMFRSERLDATRPALQEAIQATRVALRQAAAARTPTKTLPPLELAAQGTAAWALVHGFSMLLLEGRLDTLMKMLPGNVDSDMLLEAVLNATRVG